VIGVHLGGKELQTYRSLLLPHFFTYISPSAVADWSPFSFERLVFPRMKLQDLSPFDPFLATPDLCPLSPSAEPSFPLVEVREYPSPRGKELVFFIWKTTPFALSRRFPFPLFQRSVSMPSKFGAGVFFLFLIFPLHALPFLFFPYLAQVISSFR